MSGSFLSGSAWKTCTVPSVLQNCRPFQQATFRLCQKTNGIFVCRANRPKALSGKGLRSRRQLAQRVARPLFPAPSLCGVVSEPAWCWRKALRACVLDLAAALHADAGFVSCHPTQPVLCPKVTNCSTVLPDFEFPSSTILAAGWPRHFSANSRSCVYVLHTPPGLSRWSKRLETTTVPAETPKNRYGKQIVKERLACNAAFTSVHYRDSDRKVKKMADTASACRVRACTHVECKRN